MKPLWTQQGENIRHLLLHTGMALIDPRTSYTVAMAIEVHDSTNGRLELIDWVTRFGGVWVGTVIREML